MSKVYQIVTDQIVKSIEANNVLPWAKPWKVTGTSTKSYTNHEYRGINVFLALISGRPGPWITLNQTRKVGGRIKDGEFQNSQIVTFYTTWEKDKPGSDKKDRIPIFRFYKVWSLEQTENVPIPAWLAKERAKDASDPIPPIEGAEALFEAYQGKPEVTYGGDRACYRPLDDKISMPIRDSFKGPEEFYSTLFHEAIHSTGHASRLGRLSGESPAPFGSCDYSKEELVAEVGAAMLCAVVGIENKTIDNSIAYVKNWLSRLQDDPKLIIQAASAAQKACDLIRGTTFDYSKPKDADAGE